MSREIPDYGTAGRQFSLVALQDDGVRDVRPALLALLGGVTLLLLIACVNVASSRFPPSASRHSSRP